MCLYLIACVFPVHNKLQSIPQILKLCAGNSVQLSALYGWLSCVQCTMFSRYCIQTMQPQMFLLTYDHIASPSPLPTPSPLQYVPTILILGLW